uniref:Uncharacterized protein n=1 Tax=Panagrolaimus sp. ES5 TaxID=591445 RepID=A0AC34GRH8_9BILA
MSRLVQYDSDEETPRLSTSKDSSILNPSTTQNYPSKATETIDEEMPEASPEVQIIPSESKINISPPSDAQIRQQSPYIEGYAEPRKATPINIAPEVQQKFNYMFRLKAQGRNLEQELDGKKAFNNPALYDLLLENQEKFKIDFNGSALDKFVRVFNIEDFEKNDFYDQLGKRQ